MLLPVLLPHCPTHGEGKKKSSAEGMCTEVAVALVGLIQMQVYAVEE